MQATCFGCIARLSVTCLLVLQGCTPLSPQIFSDDMLKADESSDLKVTVVEAKAGAMQAMHRYTAAVQELSGLTPKIGAGLIGLSALALLKSISHSSGTDIAGVGVVGSAAYLYGSTMVSKPRQAIYLAGSRALACAVAASAPYDVSEDEQFDLQDELAEMTLQSSKLQLTLSRHSDVLGNLNRPVAARKPAATCSSQLRPSCERPAAAEAAASADERKVFAERCAAVRSEWEQLCAAKPATTVLETPNPLLSRAKTQADAELQAANLLEIQVVALQGKLRSAGSDLRWQSQQVQLRVSEEVLKTEPDLSLILAATRSSRGTALILSGAAALKSPDSELQAGVRGATKATRQLDASALDALNKIEVATFYLRLARRTLSNRVAPIEQAVRGLRTTLQQCEVSVPGIALQVHPDVDEIAVPSGGKQVFHVWAGMGRAVMASVASLGGGKSGTATPEPDGVRFTYVAPDTGIGPSGESLLFTDISRQAQRTVLIRSPVAGGTSAGTLLKKIEEADKTKLGLPAGASDAQIKAAISLCQAKVGTPITGEYDANTDEEVRKSKCDGIAKLKG